VLFQDIGSLDPVIGTAW